MTDPGPEVVVVDHVDDPRLDELRGLTDADARALTEAAHGCFVAEGLRTIEAVVASPYPLRSVLVADNKLHRVRALLQGVDATVYVGTQALLEAVTGFPIHRGVVASVARLPLPSVADLVRTADRLLVVEGVNDHENLGALFRNAAAFGIDGVLLDPTCADPLYRRSVRVSVGHVLRVPWTRTPALPAGLALLHEAGVATLALTPAGERTTEEAARDHGPGRLAWIVGAEGAGLSAATMSAATETVRIPIAAGVDSLNVATAAAVAMSRTARLG